MLLSTDYIEPAILTGYVRAALADFQINQFTLSGYLPNRIVDDLDYRFTSGGQGLADVAEYRSYDTEASIGKRHAIKRVTGELPPISQKLRFGEYDRLRQRRAADLNLQIGIENDAAKLTRGISARIELARADALVNGSVTIEENGVIGTIDFNRPSACEVTPAGALWSDPTSADPIADLTTWVQAYIVMNGEPPGDIVVSTRIANFLARSQALRNIASSLAGVPTILSRDVIQNILSSFALPDIVVYDAAVNLDGVSTRVLPDNVVLLVPDSVSSPDDYEGTQLGGTFWGTTAESLEPGYGIEEGDQPGIVAGVYTTEDPVALWTKASAISVPVLANPQLAWVATVAAGD